MAKTNTATKSAKQAVIKPKLNGATQDSLSAQKTNLLLAAFEQLNPQRIILLLALLSCFAYANSLGGDFVFDDLDQIVKNTAIRRWDNLGKAFTTHVWQFRERPEWLRVPIPPPYYRPLFTVLFTVEYQMFGLWQQGWHLVSLLLHLLCAIAVYYVLLRLAKRKSVAVIVAALFAIYPVHVESVSWISGVTDPLFGLFALWSFYFYLRFKDERHRAQLIYSLLFFIFAVLSKETALTLVPLIFIFALIDSAKVSNPVSPTRNPAQSGNLGLSVKQATLMVLPYLGVVALYLIARFLVLGSLTWYNPTAYHGPFIHTLWTLPWIICTYVLHLLYPMNLSIAYATDYVKSPLSLSFLLPMLALVGAIGALVYYRKKINKEIWQALALLFIPLLLVLDIRNLSVEYLIADRYLYLSVIGWGYLIALGIAKLAAKEENQALRQGESLTSIHRLGVASLTLVVLAVLLIAVTLRENSTWANGYSLWENAARVRPNLWVAPYNAGLELLNVKRYSEARDALNRAAQLKADEPAIYNVLGQVYTGMGETSRAIESFKRALDVDPEMFEALNNLGTIYFNSGDYPAAERYFKSSLALKPQAVASRFNLAMCYSRQHRLTEALPELEGCLAYTPDDAEVLYELGTVYEKLERKADARKTLEQGLQISKAHEKEDSAYQSLTQKIGESLSRLGK